MIAGRAGRGHRLRGAGGGGRAGGAAGGLEAGGGLAGQAATSGVAAGIEILDSRYLDYRFTLPDVIADNTSAGRFVIGAPVAPAGIGLRLVGVVLERDGEGLVAWQVVISGSRLADGG